MELCISFKIIIQFHLISNGEEKNVCNRPKKVKTVALQEGCCSMPMRFFCFSRYLFFNGKCPVKVSGLLPIPMVSELVITDFQCLFFQTFSDLKMGFGQYIPNIHKKCAWLISKSKKGKEIITKLTIILCLNNTAMNMKGKHSLKYKRQRGDFVYLSSADDQMTAVVHGGCCLCSISHILIYSLSLEKYFCTVLFPSHFCMYPWVLLLKFIQRNFHY